MQPNKQRKNRIFAILLHWWLVAAVYFYIGWGTGLGNRTSMLDFMLILGFVIGLAESFILEPLQRRFFDFSYRPYQAAVTVGQRLKKRFGAALRSMVIVTLLVFVYAFLNRLLIRLLGMPQDSLPLPGEPISFGLLYMGIRLAWEKLVQVITRRGKVYGNIG